MQNRRKTIVSSINVLKRIRIHSHDLALNNDRSIVAVMQSGSVCLCSFPQLDVKAKIQVRDPWFVFFMEDIDQFATVNYSGRVYFISDDNKVYRYRFPKPVYKVIYSIGGHLIGDTPDGIVILDLKNKKTHSCLDTKYYVQTINIENGIIHSIWSHRKAIIKETCLKDIDFEGNVISERFVEKKLTLAGSFTHIDGWGAVTVKKTALKKEAWIVAMDDTGVKRDVASFPVDYRDVTPMLVCADSPQYIVLACRASLKKHVMVFKKRDFSFVCRLDDLDDIGNEPCAIKFISESEFLLGTWNEVLLCRIEE